MMTICVNEHDMVYSGTDDRNSDIADMSDFSDSDDETQEEIRPGPRTGSDRRDSIGVVSGVGDRPVTKTVTAEDDRDSLDPNDMEYWTKFRLLMRQAFLLDDDCLSDSNFPDAVKDVVRRSRLTMMALDEYDAPPLEQQTDNGTPDCSDGGIVWIRMTVMMNMVILNIGRFATQSYQGWSQVRLVMSMSMIHQWFRIMCVRSVGGEMMYRPMSTRNYW